MIAEHHIPQDLRVNLFEFGPQLLEFGKLILLFPIGNGFAGKTVGFTVLLQSGIVEFTTQRKPLLKSCLRLGKFIPRVERSGLPCPFVKEK